MNAVLISLYFESEADDGRLEIDVEIEQIPPLGFEFGFNIPHPDGKEGYLALEVTGYHGQMGRTPFKKCFSSEPIEILVRPNGNSESGMDYEAVKNYLDRRVPFLHG